MSIFCLTGARVPVFDHQDIDLDFETLEPNITLHLVAIDTLINYIAQNPPQLDNMTNLGSLRERYLGTQQAVQENQCTLIENHVRFDKTEIGKIMRDNVLYLASIREPISHLKSLCHFFYLYSTLFNITGDNKFEVFITEPEFYDTKRFTQNFLAKEFGYDEGVTNLDAFLEMVNTTFDIVLSERFEESLMILKRKYHWTLKDLLYIKLLRTGYTEKRENTDAAMKTKLCTWSPVDCKLYNMLKNRHMNLERDYPGNLQEELTIYQNMNKIVYSACSSFFRNITKRWVELDLPLGDLLKQIELFNITFPKTAYSESFNVDCYDCLAMMLNDKVIHWLLRVRQRPNMCSDRVWETLVYNNVFIGYELKEKHVIDLLCSPKLEKYNLPYNLKYEILMKLS